MLILTMPVMNISDKRSVFREALRVLPAARRHGRAPEGGGGLFAIRDLPNARKPANGEPSGTEPGPLADPQGTTKHPSDVVKFNDLDGEFVVR
jgi:hypothetical protein